jgi:hypothetical protein
VHAHAAVGVLDLLEAGAELLLDAALAEGALEQLAAALLLQRHQVRQRLDDRDLGAERAPDAGELAADGARAQDHDGGGDVLEAQRVVAGDDALVVDLEARDGAGDRAGGQQHVLGLDAPAVDLDGGGGDQRAGALDDLDLAALDQAGEALVQPLDDLALVGVDARHVDLVEAAVDAELLGLLDDLDGLGRVQQRLGRDAAAVQAGAADLVLLDHDDALAELGVAQRGRVAAAAPSEDDEVDGLGLGHGGDSSIDGLCGRAGGSAGTR